MINLDSFKSLLLSLNFTQNDSHYSKKFGNSELAADFENEKLIYPDTLIISNLTTSNFSSNENFVVFECVHRLLEKGYAPESIELEPQFPSGRDMSGGRADILVSDRQGNSLLIIECKTAGKEFEEAWLKTKEKTYQLFSYAHQKKSTKFLCLYASNFENETLNVNHYVIDLNDDEDEIKKDAGKNQKRFFYKDATDANGLFKAWSETYGRNYQQNGIFENDAQIYNIGKKKLTFSHLNDTEMADKFNKFAEILRTHNVSSKESAFDKLINLFLCKIVDEKNSQKTEKDKNEKELEFYWKGIYADNHFDLIDRLQRLYQQGMDEFLGETITLIDRTAISKPFDDYFKQGTNAVRDAILDLFKQQKYFTNSDFGFIDVHNEKLFYQNVTILLDVIELWQRVRLTGDTQNQFLGNMFELFLDKGFKQSEGQFFTPIPICRFILHSLPLAETIKNNPMPPKVIDYACGCGHFLTEYASEIKAFIDSSDENELKKYYSAIYGVEKEYRLSKVAKISAFMYGQDEINVIYCDALNAIKQDIRGKTIKVENETCDILVANPPFAVDGFLTTLSAETRGNYDLTQTISDTKNGNIQCFFIERAKQLLKPNGIAAIIVPSSVLSNSDKTHIGSREILLKHFDVVALVQLENRTFGATGTTTVVLFLRRKDKNPTEASQYFNRVNDWFSPIKDGDEIYHDRHFIERYCDHIHIPFEQYQTLLNGEPSVQLLAHEMFVDYRKDFDNSTDITKLKAQKFFKDFTSEQKKIELEKRFLTYLRTIEKDKLFYFVLAYLNPQKVLVIKSPSDNKEQKAFLGYGWSDRKGAEGIQLTTDSNGNHLTPLYDETNRDNPEKINALITQNFLGELVEIPDVLQPFASLMNLVDMLDFSRKDFDKTISLTVKKSVEIQSKWNLIRVESVLLKIDGDITKIQNQAIKTEGKYPVITQEKDKLISGYTDLDKPVTDLPLIIFGDHSCTFKYVDFQFIRGADGTQLLKVNPEMYLLKCFFYLIQLVEITNNDKYERHFKYLAGAKIPLPPLKIQQQIVNECEAIDGEVEKANLEIQTAKTAIDETMQRCFNGGFVLEKLEKVLALEYGKPLPEKQRTTGEYPVMGSNGISGYHNEFLVEAPAIIVGRKGSAGKIVYIEQNCFPIDTTFYVKPIKPCAMKYLYYILLAMELEKMIKGIGVPGINRNDVYQLQIPVPDLETQQTLVTQISTFEKQIDDAQKVIDGAANRKAAVLRNYL